LKPKILSLNIGVPEKMEWQGKSMISSMRKTPVPGPLIVHSDKIEGNVFAHPQFHGTLDSVLYAYGMSSIMLFMRLLGRESYDHGALGETVTVDELDETDVSVGDIFSFGEVLAQAVYPRIPCAKVNLRMQHKDGQKLMQECGLSGVYFRIIKPGMIYKTDIVTRTERSQFPFKISDLYRLIIRKEAPNSKLLELARSNPAFSKGQLEKWSPL
jgi:MOSC domain-containing protein YiiM